MIIAVVFVPLWLGWRFAPVPKNNRRLTWNQSIAIIVATIIVGNALVVLWPLWLAPPRLSDTPFLYLILAVVWYPLTLIFLLLRPAIRGKFSGPMLLGRF